MTTISAPRGAKSLRSTPGVRGYALCWLVSVLVSPLPLGLGLAATSRSLEELGHPEHWILFWIWVVPFAAVAAAPFGLVLIPFLHWVTYEAKRQRTHVIAFGVVVTLAYGLPFLVSEGFPEALFGLVPGSSAAIGRWAVSGERLRTR